MKLECLPPVEVKREPSEEFLLILPPATEDEPQHMPEPEPVAVKREPPEDFLLILPPVTEDEPGAEQEIVSAKVKREPSVEFVLILPPATEDEPEPVQAEVDKTKQKRSKKLSGSSSEFKCDQCSYQTDQKGYLTRHKRIHNKSISCESCQKKFATNQTLKRHQMQRKHGSYETAEEETFSCDRCDKSFRTRYNLGQHQRYVHDENEVKCEICGKTCRNRASLRMHSRYHVKVECSICLKMIPKSSIAAHKRAHSTEKSFVCDLCEYSAKTKSNLKEHIERMHLLRRLVNDAACRADFSDFKLLEELQRKHGIVTLSSEKKFKCDKCDKAFATPQKLNDHKRQVHTEKTFRCEICKRAFKTRGNLKQHKTNVHSKVSCSICRKQFGQRSLQAHVKLHLPGQHFECDFCGYKSVQKQHLKRHIDRRHRNKALKRNFGCREGIANVQPAPSSQHGELRARL